MTTVFLNNFNDLTWTRGMVEWLQQIDCRVVIVDNASTWEPLLEWYDKECPCEVVHAGKNIGKIAPWATGAVKRYADGCYVISDSDLDLNGVPFDVIDELLHGLSLKGYVKCGLSLHWDDLPDGFPMKEWVTRHESKFWMKPVMGGRFFDAPIDTTFCMYRRETASSSSAVGLVGGTQRALRTNKPYTARHMPWYVTPENVTEEFKHRTSRVENGAYSIDFKRFHEWAQE